MLKFNIIGFCIFILSLNSYSQMLEHSDPWIKKSPTAQQLLETSFLSYDYEGIVALSNCSGSLVRLENGSDSDLALVLTNGHCMHGGFPQPGEVRVNQSSNRKFRILNSSSDTVGSVRAKRLVYGTMTKTDMAIYELEMTYQQIYEQFTVRPLTLSSVGPQIGDGIEILSGYWRRGFTCSVQKFVHKLQESGWTMENSIRYQQPGCEIYGGTSGSPVVLAGTRTVIGVNNTGNESGRLCTMNNPCEVDENGKKTAEKGAAYAQQTAWFYSCLNSSNQLDLSKKGCLLPR